MKLVLVAGMNTRVKKLGPKVRLFAGDYRICVEHYKDCKLVLHTTLGDSADIKHGHTIIVAPHQGNHNWWLEVSDGSEDYINVFAEVINGPVTSATS